MYDGIMLTEKTKEELIEIILEERKQRDELENRIRELEEKVNAERKKRTERFAKANTTKRKKRPGQKPGHVGMTRAIPDHIDEVIEETLCQCPDCKNPLGSPLEVEDVLSKFFTLLLFIFCVYREF